MKISNRNLVLFFTFLLILIALFIGLIYLVSKKRNESPNNIGSLQLTYKNECYYYDGFIKVEDTYDYLKNFQKLEQNDYISSFIPKDALQNAYFDKEKNIIFSYPAIFPSNGENTVNVFRRR